ncbi:hypothetical protein EW145_g4887, partial [Phellinidium pouzarii]
YWRTIALDSPRLWTYAKVEVINQALSPALKLLPLYLLRSNLCSIVIDVDFLTTTAYSEQSSNPLRHLFEEIVNLACQYRPAYILEDSRLMTHLETSSTERQPTREEWYFWTSGIAKPSRPSSVLSGSSSDSDTQLIGTSHTTPDSLPSVTIRAQHVSVGTFTLEPYTSWTPSLAILILNDHNHFTHLTPNKAAHILRTSPLLLYYSVHIDYADLPDDAEQGEPIELIYLRSLEMSWAVWVDPGPLFDMLCTPSLESLKLALSWTPNLERLWLEGCLLDDTVIHGLYSGGNGVLRTLSTLILDECYGVDIEVLALVLEEHASANGGNPPPMRVHVYNCGMVDPAHIRLSDEMNITNIEF